MKILNKEITVANKFIFYYANFVDKIFGYVVRKDGQNIPEEHYFGRIDEESGRVKGRARHKSSSLRLPLFHRQGDPQAPELAGRDGWKKVPEKGEIILCVYRKRLLLACFEKVIRRGKYSVVTEDRRTVVLRGSAVIYLTGVSVGDDNDVLATYSSSIRGLAGHIDLQEIWQLFHPERKSLSISDLATLYWEGDVDPSRWLALYIHVDENCPYFTTADHKIYTAIDQADVENRKKWMTGEETKNLELVEFVSWLEGGEAYDAATLTDKQQAWLQQITDYALWGSEAKAAVQSKMILSSLPGSRSHAQHMAVDILVKKGIWGQHENLELIRSGYPTEFSNDAISEMQTIDFEKALKGRSGKVVRDAVVIQDPCYPISHLAFSMRKRWLGGFELGVHLLDISAWISRDSSLDIAGADRIGSLDLPDRPLPLLPLPAEWISFEGNEKRPSLSLTWRLDKKLNIRSFSLKRTVVRTQNAISSGDVARILKGADIEQSGQVQRLNMFARFFEATRREHGGGVDPRMECSSVRETAGCFEPLTPEPTTHAMLRELCLFVSTEVGKWCQAKHLPAVYIQQDAPENLEHLQRISDPVVRTHELERQTPAPMLVAEPLDETPFGTPAPCTILFPVTRYTDLIVQRQITHHLEYESNLYSKAELDVLRYRATEELAQLSALQHDRERYLTLKHLSELDSDRTYSAIVLHIGRRGTLVQLLEFPLKTGVHPVQEFTVGDRIELMVSGVDLRHSKAHFLVK